MQHIIARRPNCGEVERNGCQDRLSETERASGAASTVPRSGATPTVVGSTPFLFISESRFWSPLEIEAVAVPFVVRLVECADPLVVCPIDVVCSVCTGAFVSIERRSNFSWIWVPRCFHCVSAGNAQRGRRRKYYEMEVY